MQQDVDARYSTSAPFHAEVNSIVAILEFETQIKLTPEDKSLALHSVAFALHLRDLGAK